MADALARPAWFPDWRGQSAAIIASGPSVRKADVELLAGRLRLVAIKESSELCRPDVVYGCDAPWWKNSLGLPKFGGLKVAYDASLTSMYPDIRIIGIDKKSDRPILDRPGTVGSGGNSGFQALNLVVQFGATRILLVGFDMHDNGSVHWFGRSRGNGRNNPDEGNFRRWRAAFDGSAEIYRTAGVEIVNASPTSTLKAYRKASVADTLEEWRL